MTSDLWHVTGDLWLIMTCDLWPYNGLWPVNCVLQLLTNDCDFWLVTYGFIWLIMRLVMFGLWLVDFDSNIHQQRRKICWRNPCQSPDLVAPSKYPSPLVNSKLLQENLRLLKRKRYFVTNPPCCTAVVKTRCTCQLGSTITDKTCWDTCEKWGVSWSIIL